MAGGNPADLDRPDVCHLTTIGRVTGKPHRIEIWFAHHQGTLYLLSGGGERSDWVQNLRRYPEVTVRLGRRSYKGTGRIVTDPGEGRLARDRVFGKYSQRYSDDLEEWRETALPVAVDLAV